MVVVKKKGKRGDGSLMTVDVWRKSKADSRQTCLSSRCVAHIIITMCKQRRSPRKREDPMMSYWNAIIHCEEEAEGWGTSEGNQGTRERGMHGMERSGERRERSRVGENVWNFRHLGISSKIIITSADI
jgi:hypothetical protein